MVLGIKRSGNPPGRSPEGVCLDRIPSRNICSVVIFVIKYANIFHSLCIIW